MLPDLKLSHESKTLLLPDGRTLGYAQYGAAKGDTILYLHGHVASRFEAASLHELSLHKGVCITAPDRPGFGLSSPNSALTLRNYPDDAMYLMDYLKLSSYYILVCIPIQDGLTDMIILTTSKGVSGGGPYACVRFMPEAKLKRVSIVCGLGPVAEIGMKGARWQNNLGFRYGYRYLPSSLTSWFWKPQPYGRIDWTDDERLKQWMQDVSKLQGIAREKDFDILTDEHVARHALRCGREAFSQGFDAAVQDGRLLSSPFDFRIQDIRKDLPFQLWYGKYDTNVPSYHGETIAKRLGDQATLMVKEETHTSILFRWRAQILEELLMK